MRNLWIVAILVIVVIAAFIPPSEGGLIRVRRGGPQKQVTDQAKKGGKTATGAAKKGQKQAEKFKKTGEDQVKNVQGKIDEFTGGIGGGDDDDKKDDGDE